MSASSERSQAPDSGLHESSLRDTESGRMTRCVVGLGLGRAAQR